MGSAVRLLVGWFTAVVGIFCFSFGYVHVVLGVSVKFVGMHRL